MAAGKAQPRCGRASALRWCPPRPPPPGVAGRERFGGVLLCVCPQGNAGVGRTVSPRVTDSVRDGVRLCQTRQVMEGERWHPPPPLTREQVPEPLGPQLCAKISQCVAFTVLGLERARPRHPKAGRSEGPASRCRSSSWGSAPSLWRGDRRGHDIPPTREPLQRAGRREDPTRLSPQPSYPF